MKFLVYLLMSFVRKKWMRQWQRIFLHTKQLGASRYRVECFYFAIGTKQKIGEFEIACRCHLKDSEGLINIQNLSSDLSALASPRIWVFVWTTSHPLFVFD